MRKARKVAYARMSLVAVVAFAVASLVGPGWVGGSSAVSMPHDSGGVALSPGPGSVSTAAFAASSSARARRPVA